MKAYLNQPADESVFRRSAMGFNEAEARNAMPLGKDLIIYNDRANANVRRSFVGCTGGYYPQADYRDEPWGVRFYHKKTDITDWIPAGVNPFKQSGMA